MHSKSKAAAASSSFFVAQLQSHSPRYASIVSAREDHLCTIFLKPPFQIMIADVPVSAGEQLNILAAVAALTADRPGRNF